MRRGEDNPLLESTMHKYRCCFRNFFDYHDRPFWDAIDGSGPNNTTRETVDASELLTPEEIAALRKATTNNRDATLIDMLADTAARIGLLCTLRVGDVDFGAGDRVSFTPNAIADGLKNIPNKPYPLIGSQSSLKAYLNNYHPRPNDPDAPLFHKHSHRYQPEQGDDGALTYQGVRSNLERTKERAGIEKPVNPHNFRHTAITRMRSEGFPRDEIRHRVGWTMDTQMWERYDHLSAEERNDQIFARTGVIDEDETPSPERQKCRNCNEITEPNYEFCPNCGDPLDSNLRDAIEDQDDRLFESAAAADDDLAAAIRELRDLFSANPELRAALLDY